VLAAVFAASGFTTVYIALSASLRFAYRLPALHVAIETVAALISVVAAYLISGRFHRRRRLDDLILACALTVFALTNLAFGAVTATVPGATGAFATWAAIAGRVTGTAALVAAAFAPRRSVRSERLSWGLPAIALGLVAAAALTVALLEPHLPPGVDAQLPPESSGRPHLVGHPAVLAVQLVLMTLFAAAAVGFARRGERERDEFMWWLAGAMILGAFARLNYFLYPSLYTDFVYTGDAFRLLFYAAILVAGAREVRSYWQAAATAAVLEERRRMARDLHDGLAQELAFIGRNVRRLDRDDPTVRRVEAGAARALEESRRAIAALTEPLDRPLDVALAEAAHDVAAREGTRVALALARDVVVPHEQREALVRIASEAITNAARHGCADLVRVELEADGCVRMRIADGGRGFDPEQPRARGGFGLISMRERAESLGGRVRVDSAPGRGTEVEVVL
jgi:signal transduction histidine kinase